MDLGQILAFYVLDLHLDGLVSLSWSIGIPIAARLLRTIYILTLLLWFNLGHCLWLLWFRTIDLIVASLRVVLANVLIHDNFNLLGFKCFNFAVSTHGIESFEVFDVHKHVKYLSEIFRQPRSIIRMVGL